MKNRIFIFLLLLALMLFSTACTGSTDLSNPAQESSQMSPAYTEADNYQEESSMESEPEIGRSSPAAEASGAAASAPAYKGFRLNNLSGKVKNVYYGGGPKVLVTTSNTLYLYDLSQDAIAAEAEIIPGERSYRNEHYKPIKNGFVGILLDLNRPDAGGALQGGERAPNVTCVFYDLQLNRTAEINVLDALAAVMSEDDQRFGIQELRVVDVSDDGSKIAVGSISSLYLYDIENKTGQQIVPESKNMIPGDVCFAGNSRIAFGGAYLPSGAPESAYSYGSVNTDGSGLQIHVPQDFRAGELPGATGSFVLIGQDMRAASGQLLLHPFGEKEKTIMLSTAKEGDMAYLSEDGTYFATSVNGEKLTVRIYEVATGSLLAEASISAEDEALISRVPDVRILDSLRTAIVIYGQHVDTRIEIIPF